MLGRKGRNFCGPVSSAIVGIDGTSDGAGEETSIAEDAGATSQRGGRGGGAPAALPVTLGTGGAARLGGKGADILSLSVIVGLNTHR